MKKKNLILLLTTLCTLTACGGNGPSAKRTLKDLDVHYVEGTLHDINIDYKKGVPFIVNNYSDYEVVHLDDADALKAAAYICNQVNSATGYFLPRRTYVPGETFTADSKVIFLGEEETFDVVDITKTTKDLGITGYQITTYGKGAYLYASGKEAYELAALKFLEATVGYELFYGEYIIYEKDGSVLPKMDIVERPDFDYRKIDDRDTDWRYGAGFTDNIIFMTVGGNQYHTSFQIIPPEIWSPTHPEWFTDRTIADGITSASKGANQGQLCYTAHGDDVSKAIMEQEAANKIIETLDANPNLYNVTFTIEDNYYVCDCDACKAVAREYNDSNAAAILFFMNDVEEIVDAHYEQVAQQTGNKKRDYFIAFFAYHATEVPPVNYDPETDTYTAINNIHTNEHVAVFLAPISSLYTHSFYEVENSDASSKVKGWSVCTDTIYCWLYETNFHNYFYPYNTWRSMLETLRFIKSYGCSLLYLQDQHDNYSRSVFSRLKLYINQKMMINVNIDVEYYIDRFFKIYYDKGASYMRDYFEECTQWLKYQESAFPAVFSGSIYNEINDPKYWNEHSLRKWEQLTYKALDAISYMESNDPVKYQLTHDAILVESLSPRWMLLDLYDSSFTSEELEQRRTTFKEDADYFGFDRYREWPRPEQAGALSDVYKNWGLM